MLNVCYLAVILIFLVITWWLLLFTWLLLVVTARSTGQSINIQWHIYDRNDQQYFLLKQD